MKLKRVIVSLGPASVVPLVYWLGGYNFDERGLAAVSCLLYALVVYGAAITWPGWCEDVIDTIDT